MSARTEKEAKRAIVPPNAFLIVNSQVFPLDQEVINIGRSLENHLVIDDPSVSRAHAQLDRDQRIISWSLIRTRLEEPFVNGKRISRTVLNSGDIVSLAAVSMLYVEDSPGLLSKSWEQTRPLGQDGEELDDDPEAREPTQEPSGDEEDLL